MGLCDPRPPERTSDPKGKETTNLRTKNKKNRTLKRAINRNWICSRLCKHITKWIELNNSNGLYKLSKIEVKLTKALDTRVHRILCTFIGGWYWNLLASRTQECWKVGF